MWFVVGGCALRRASELVGAFGYLFGFGDRWVCLLLDVWQRFRLGCLFAAVVLACFDFAGDLVGLVA